MTGGPGRELATVRPQCVGMSEVREPELVPRALVVATWVLAAL